MEDQRKRGSRSGTPSQQHIRADGICAGQLGSKAATPRVLGTGRDGRRRKKLMPRWCFIFSSHHSSPLGPSALPPPIATTSNATGDHAFETSSCKMPKAIRACWGWETGMYGFGHCGRAIVSSGTAYDSQVSESSLDISSTAEKAEWPPG